MDVATLRTSVETDLGDDALQMMLDAADEDLTLAVGPDAADVCTVDMEGERFLFVSRPMVRIISIKETIGTTVTTLATNDWKQWTPQRLERLSTGTNAASGWYGMVEVSFAPGDLQRRNRALVQLVQLAVDFRPGGSRESIGDHSRDQASYDVERARILSAVGSWGFA